MSVPLLRAAIALLTRKYFLDMLIYSHEREQVCVCVCAEKCIVEYCKITAKQEHLSKSESLRTFACTV